MGLANTLEQTADLMKLARFRSTSRTNRIDRLAEVMRPGIGCHLLTLSTAAFIRATQFGITRMYRATDCSGPAR